MKFILGKKIEMSQIFCEDGRVVPVTLIQAGPCLVTQVKDKDKDGYQAIQLGFGQKKELKKPQKGHLKELGNLRYLKEFRYKNEKLPENIKRGAEIKATIFSAGDKVDVIGISKGKGFQGVVKRHGFSGGPATHGHKDQLRMPGSIGAGGVAKVLKGQRMPGRMGYDQVTVKNLEIIKIDQEKNILAIKGAVPGPRNGLIIIHGTGDLIL